MSKEIKSVLRMRKRHTPTVQTEAREEDGRNLLQQQSIRDASLAAVIVLLLFSILWAMLSTLTGRIFPWMTLLLGVFVGLAVRRAGMGLDWHAWCAHQQHCCCGCVYGRRAWDQHVSDLAGSDVHDVARIFRRGGIVGRCCVRTVRRGYRGVLRESSAEPGGIPRATQMAAGARVRPATIIRLTRQPCRLVTPAAALRVTRAHSRH